MHDAIGSCLEGWSFFRAIGGALHCLLFSSSHRQRVIGVSNQSIRSVLVGNMAESGSKKPMSPSEFFAKIYGDSKSPSESSSSAVTSPHHRASREFPLSASNRWTEASSVAAAAQQNEPCWMYPAWHPDFWTARSFYNPLDITPALTALSTFQNLLNFAIERLGVYGFHNSIDDCNA